MGASRDERRGTRDERRGKRRRLSPDPPSLGDGASSSSSALHLQHADLPGDTLTKDPDAGVILEAFRDLEGAPPRARLQAQGRPPPGAALEAQGRPPPAEGKEDLFLGILPPDPARFEIMERIPSDDPPPALTLPPKAMFDGLEKCLQGHRQPSGEGDAAQGCGKLFDTPSRTPNGHYG